MSEILAKATAKGYKELRTNQFIEDFEKLARIQFWLLEEYNICIAALPFYGKYSYMIGSATGKAGDLTPGSGTLGSHDSWMGAFKAAITEALNLLPDAE